MKNSSGFYRRFFAFFFSVFVLFFSFSLVTFVYYAGQLPEPEAIAARRVSESTRIFDRTGGVLLYDVHGEEKRTIIPWEQIPETVKKATLASEDADFYSHSGIDFKGIARAIYKDFISFSASQGGSTITQQLIKNSVLSQEKTLSRKIKEIAFSIQVERKFTKDQIFWMYLNQIPYGSNAYGIEAASQTYFGKRAENLTLAEAALLAALPKAPSYYSPYGSHVDELFSRRNNILDSMKNLSLISVEEYEAALKEKLSFETPSRGIKAPHFVIMVKEYLAQKYGSDMVENGGLKVVTTLAADLQENAEEVVKKYAEINEKKYKARNAALVSVDPKTGQILTMVGSRDYFDLANDGNFNVALGFRQPGSSFKPFAYAKLFENGFTDSTVFFDLKTEFNPNCDPLGNQEKDSFGLDCYSPRNYDGRFRGPVTAREALAQSLNVPSVKVLYLAGLDKTIDLAKKMGISTLNDRSRYGLSLVLGGGEVRLLDMVSAYGVFANDGIKAAPNFILRVIASNGTVLEEYRSDEERIIDPQIARLISDVLSDNKARGPVFGYNSSLYFPDRQVAAKTGTTQENRDGWLIGYTPSLVVGVWTGNNDNTPMTKEGAGVSAAGPMWREFLQFAFRDTPPEEFLKPDPVISDKIMLNGNFNGPDGIHTLLYYINKGDLLGQPPVDPSLDPQFKNWEVPVRNWGGF